MAFNLKPIISLLILAISISCATSARLLDEGDVAAPVVGPGSSITTGTSVPAGASTSTGTSVPAGTTIPGGAEVSTPVSATNGIPGGAAAAVPIIAEDHGFTFYMHDILGGTHPSALAVTGIVANPAVGGQVPFAKPNGAVLAVNNGIPTNNNNAGIISNNNIPFLTGLSGFSSNILSNDNGNNIIGGMPGFPVLNSAQFPSGTTLQQLMFGTMTVFNDELTEGHELGSGLVGKAQGFYLSSSQDGSSFTMAFNVMFASGSYADTLSFFGVHRAAVAESHLAIMGGTGKYVNAKGFAKVKTILPANTQHETDGMETVLEITVYLAY
ncbi:Disease resistance-responsive family protein [Dorcoceras hygrometricum]|uniref:Dirigent protein n=1 Tax=Dorcoceras hygrometricum TaxID=472368 RepID=A0A2Z7AAH8_9LAMI|nr:Disease resistance-responsive family protein [Dorcoceras hygrometricum]